MDNENQILLLLGEIKGQIYGFISRLDKVEAYEERIRKLEGKGMFMVGVASAISTAVSVAGYFLHG